MSFGSLEGLPWETLEARWQEALVRFEGFEPPGGETFDDLRRRVLDFVDSLPPGRHLVFTHGGVLRLLSREVGEDHFVPTGSLLVVDWEGRRIVFAPRRRGPAEPRASDGRPTSRRGDGEAQLPGMRGARGRRRIVPGGSRDADAGPAAPAFDVPAFELEEATVAAAEADGLGRAHVARRLAEAYLGADRGARPAGARAAGA